MCEPGYEMLWAKDIPKYHSIDGKVEAVVIAGELGEAKSRVRKSTPLAYFHVKVKQGGTFEYVLPKDQNCFVYTVGGVGLFGASGGKLREVEPIHGVIYAQDGEKVEIQNQKAEILEFLLLAGKPFGVSRQSALVALIALINSQSLLFISPLWSSRNPLPTKAPL